MFDEKLNQSEPDYVTHNRATWDSWSVDFVAPAEREWASPEPTWGVFAIPESTVGMFPNELNGKNTIELGCGTAYVSAWLAQRGAHPVGFDNSPKQLETARRLQQEHGIDFPLHLGNAEETPFPSESFDLAISEYGASIWCDPYKWIPEAARLLRPGGELIFLVNSTLSMLCAQDDDSPNTDRLQRSYFGMHRFEWPDDDGIEFHLAHGDMIRLLRANQFEVEDLIELQAPLNATTTFPYVTAEWANRWPAEEIWKARKKG